MDSNKISNWLQAAGNFGLLAGLVLVGFRDARKNPTTFVLPARTVIPRIFF